MLYCSNGERREKLVQWEEDRVLFGPTHLCSLTPCFPPAAPTGCGHGPSTSAQGSLRGGHWSDDSLSPGTSTLPGLHGGGALGDCFKPFSLGRSCHIQPLLSFWTSPSSPLSSCKVILTVSSHLHSRSWHFPAATNHFLYSLWAHPWMNFPTLAAFSAPPQLHRPLGSWPVCCVPAVHVPLKRGCGPPGAQAVSTASNSNHLQRSLWWTWQSHTTSTCALKRDLGGFWVWVFLVSSSSPGEGNMGEGAPSPVPPHAPGFHRALLPPQPPCPSSLLSFAFPSPNLHLCSTSTTMAIPGGLFSFVLHAFEILNPHISHSDHSCQSFYPAVFSVCNQRHGNLWGLHSFASLFPLGNSGPSGFSFIHRQPGPYLCSLITALNPLASWTFPGTSLPALPPQILLPPTLHLLCLRAWDAEYYQKKGKDYRYLCRDKHMLWASSGSMVKNPPANARNVGLIPG